MADPPTDAELVAAACERLLGVEPVHTGKDSVVTGLGEFRLDHNFAARCLQVVGERGREYAMECDAALMHAVGLLRHERPTWEFRWGYLNLTPRQLVLACLAATEGTPP